MIETRKGVLARMPDGRVVLEQWAIDRSGEPGHVPRANMLGLMDHALAFITVRFGGEFDMWTAKRGPESPEELKRLVVEQDPGLRLPKIHGTTGRDRPPTLGGDPRASDAWVIVAGDDAGDKGFDFSGDANRGTSFKWVFCDDHLIVGDRSGAPKFHMELIEEAQERGLSTDQASMGELWIDGNRATYTVYSTGGPFPDASVLKTAIHAWLRGRDKVEREQPG